MINIHLDVNLLLFAAEFHRLSGIRCVTSATTVTKTTSTDAVSTCKETSECYGVYDASCTSGSSQFFLCGTGTSNTIETGRSFTDCLSLKIDFAGNWKTIMILKYYK